VRDRYNATARNCTMTTTKLDLTGLKCQLPALMTGKAMKALVRGDRLEVHCSDLLAVIDIPALVEQGGNRIERIDRRDDAIVLLIEKQNDAIANRN
jgi:tRNA 2-thiouridine synthesizing protein A